MGFKMFDLCEVVDVAIKPTFTMDNIKQMLRDIYNLFVINEEDNQRINEGLDNLNL